MGRLWYSLDTWHQVVRLKAFYSVWPFSLSAVLPLRNLVSFHSRGSDRPSSPKQKKTKKTPAVVWHKVDTGRRMFVSEHIRSQNHCFIPLCVPNVWKENAISWGSWRLITVAGCLMDFQQTVFIKVKCWTSKFVFCLIFSPANCTLNLGVATPHGVTWCSNVAVF